MTPERVRVAEDPYTIGGEPERLMRRIPIGYGEGGILPIP